MRAFCLGLGLMLLVGSHDGTLVAQSSPFDAAAAMASEGMGGDWKNVDPNARGLVRVTIDGLKVHPFGACHPAACDWGVLRAQGFASKVDAQDTVAMLANSTTAFDKSILTISMEADGRLRVQVFTHYTDNSRRADHAFTEYFVRQ